MGTSLILAYVGMAVMLGLTCVGSAMGVVIGGNAVVASLKKNPDIFGSGMILAALPSTQGLYGFAAFFMLNSSLQGIGDGLALVQGLAVFAAALALGIAGLISAIHQGRLVANGITEMGNGHDVFSSTLILAVFPELYAILTFACSFIVMP
ncbi:MAG: V-type ATP synthase subunit K [Bacteroidales bacterium]|nr:V-type ATP synthase subunit K [Bacteroidales bacterium]